MPLDSWFDIELPKAEARAEQRVTELFVLMKRDGRVEEFQSALMDRNILHELYKEYDIEDPFGYVPQPEL